MQLILSCRLKDYSTAHINGYDRGRKRLRKHVGKGYSVTGHLELSVPLVAFHIKVGDEGQACACVFHDMQCMTMAWASTCSLSPGLRDAETPAHKGSQEAGKLLAQGPDNERSLQRGGHYLIQEEARTLSSTMGVSVCVCVCVCVTCVCV